MYAIREKFEMTALEKVAEEKFTAALQGVPAGQNAKRTKHRHVLTVVHLIYDTTPRKDRSIRDRVVAYMAKHWRAFLTSRDDRRYCQLTGGCYVDRIICTCGSSKQAKPMDYLIARSGISRRGYET